MKLEKYSKPWILAKATDGLSVHKYSWSHEKLRKKAKRMCKDGILKLESQTKDCFYYKLADR